MNEEKMYAVKNDEGKYWDFRDQGKFWELSSVFSSTTNSKEQAELVADQMGGHVVTLIEEPEKVVLTKEQAEIVEGARVSDFPGSYISSHLLMNAYFNGYTVEKEKKYNVKVPHTKDTWYYESGEGYLRTICPADDKKLRGKFTLTEIEHYGLQDYEKEEVTDDDE